MPGQTSALAPMAVRKGKQESNESSRSDYTCVYQSCHECSLPSFLPPLNGCRQDHTCICVSFTQMRAVHISHSEWAGSEWHCSLLACQLVTLSKWAEGKWREEEDAGCPTPTHTHREAVQVLFSMYTLIHGKLHTPKMVSIVKHFSPQYRTPRAT